MNANRRPIPTGTIATIEAFAAGPDAPLVHFAHATGMCAALYRSLFDRLAPHVNVVASDARGHGATTLPADPATLTDWHGYADDLVALLATLPPTRRLILAGHSMGATVSLDVAGRLAGVAGVILIEPAFIPFAVAETWTRTTLANPMAAQAARRRAVWPSRAAIADAYRGRGVFASWHDDDLAAYLDGGVRDRADGQVELACTPAWEAATFTGVSSHMAAAVAAWTAPLTLLHATERSTVMAADAATIAQRPNAVVQYFTGRDHFLPLAEPDAMAAAILAHC
jgi:pimeloyl-ACP methyl ester carboxylesterase